MVKQAEPDEKCLVILRGALGDMLLALPLLAALPAHFGAHSLTLVGNRTNLELLANQPFVSSIMDQDQAGWAGLYQSPPRLPARLTQTLLCHGQAAVISKTPGDPALSGLKRLGIPKVLAVPSRPPEGSRIHLTDHMFAASGVRPIPGPVLIIPSDEAVSRARAFLKSINLDRISWVALHPGSGSPKKNWPLNHWIELARALHEESGLGILFILGPAEAGFGEIVRKEAVSQEIRLVQSPPLPVLAALLSLGRGYVGHDSGVTHLSAKLGLPTVAIFGPTDPACWAPRGPKVRILCPPAEEGARNTWSWLNLGQVIHAFKNVSRKTS